MLAAHGLHAFHATAKLIAGDLTVFIGVHHFEAAIPATCGAPFFKAPLTIVVGIGSHQALAHFASSGPGAL